MLASLTNDASGGSIIDTKHNLSVSGPGQIKATAEERICIFCHTPHNVRRDIPFLWNRSDQTVNYIPYQSSTLYATVGQPTGASKLCLSCHDGTIALGALVSEAQEIPFRGGIRFIPAGRPTRLGTDLSDDHPVSFVYNPGLAQRKPELVHPASLPHQVRLDKDEQLQCTTCHDPHDDNYGRFLVMPDMYANLCTICHRKQGWTATSHSASSARWTGQGPDPWPHTEYDTVAENGCKNCHRSHTAGGPERLLNHAIEEDNCLVCHNGNVASTDIERELTKRSGHRVQAYMGVHDPAEDFASRNVPKHVECQDCHNPHSAASGSPSGAGRVSGSTTDVKGLNLSGQQIERSVYEHEICLKCHGQNNVLTRLPITRQIDQLKANMEFNPANPSFHPVVSAGANPDVPSLSSRYTTQSIISCTDCHNTDDPGAPRGPHGSSYKYLLEKNYDTNDLSGESSFAYALCYKCHDRNSILMDESFKGHKKHIVDQKTPCSGCHDPHGISNVQGNPINNSHLINFDLTIVQPDSQGGLYFEDLGRFTGQCFLTCHGRTHGPLKYP